MIAEAEVKILMFGSLGEQIGREIFEELSADGCTIGELRQRLVAKDPSRQGLLDPAIRASVDQILVKEDFVVRPGHELAFFPMLSGG